MALRLKGSDVAVNIVAGGIVQAELTDILSFNCTINLELLETAFLGETTSRYDEMFKGSHFDLEMQHHSNDAIILFQTIINRARRISVVATSTVINVSANLTWPDGTQVAWSWPNAFFGEIPINAASQKDYVKTKWQGASAEPDFGADQIANLNI